MRRRPEDVGGHYLVGVWPTGLRYDVPGLFEGGSGRRMCLRTRAAADARPQDHLGGVFLELDGQVRLTLDLPGGAGYGDPRERDRAAIRADIDEGLVTPEAARTHFGWEDGTP
jgi:N-methylhydantoinase B/oxoprolinase/acetone carboxylase alpha subunit